MYRSILMALALLVLAFPAAARDRRETGVDSIFFTAYLTADQVDSIANGGGYTGAVSLYFEVNGGHSRGEVPEKYRISWTVGKDYLSMHKPNPAHGRRGNIFIDSSGPESYGENLVINKIAVPAGNILRIRVRSIYADKTRGKDCTLVVSWLLFSDPMPLVDTGEYAGMYKLQFYNWYPMDPRDMAAARLRSGKGKC